VGAPLPGFALPDTSGGTTRLWDFKQRRPVLLAFPHAGGCPVCRTWLATLAARRAELADLDVAALVIVTEPVARARELRAALDLPFTVLADEKGATRDVYSLEDGVGLYVADRYLQCLGAWRSPDANGLPALAEPLTLLLAAEQEDCACGLPAWPEE
jgi:peroxiredoxin